MERFHVDYHLLDARPKAPEKQGLRGGTGESFDWALLAARRSKVPLILSGGLGPENVAEAIAATHPFAVDTASGTEAAPGRKDPEKLTAFFAAVAHGAPVGVPSPIACVARVGAAPSSTASAATAASTCPRR